MNGLTATLDRELRRATDPLGIMIEVRILYLPCTQTLVRGWPRVFDLRDSAGAGDHGFMEIVNRTPERRNHTHAGDNYALDVVHGLGTDRHAGGRGHGDVIGMVISEAERKATIYDDYLATNPLSGWAARTRLWSRRQSLEQRCDLDNR